MKNELRNVEDIVSWRLCIGCGACSYVCGNNNILLRNFTNHGIKPVVGNKCVECKRCISICPGIYNKRNNNSNDYLKELEPYCGYAIEVWEGYSNDDALRKNCSSGGIATALALYYMEHEQCDGVLQTKAKANKPWLNETVFSTTSESIKNCIGSRYSPASPCEGLHNIAASKKSCVFIGKPCDVSALKNIQTIDKKLKEKTGLTIGIFCAGTPATQGTFDFLEKNSVDPKLIKELHYRGNGWPGSFKARLINNETFEVSYPESWSFLQKYRPFRCYLCADGTSETADISCGDAWYLRGKEQKGVSLIIVRNENGKRILHSAIKKGYITARPIAHEHVIKSQEQLFGRQKEILGRLITLKLFSIPVPRFSGWHLFRNWFSISYKSKFRSIGSTLKRILIRRLFKPLDKDTLKDFLE